MSWPLCWESSWSVLWLYLQGRRREGHIKECSQSRFGEPWGFVWVQLQFDSCATVLYFTNHICVGQGTRSLTCCRPCCSDLGWILAWTLCCMFSPLSFLSLSTVLSKKTEMLKKKKDLYCPTFLPADPMVQVQFQVEAWPVLTLTLKSVCIYGWV